MKQYREDPITGEKYIEKEKPILNKVREIAGFFVLLLFTATMFFFYVLSMPFRLIEELLRK